MVMSIIEWLGESGPQHCGYCKNVNSCITGTPQFTTELLVPSNETVIKRKQVYRMWAHVLTVQDYQDLIDRGWRRSGKYCYKAIMDATCCPMYTIKCDSPNFKLTKSQKKILKNVNKFLCSKKPLTESDFCERTSLEQENMEMEPEDCTISYSQQEIIRDISSVKPLEQKAENSMSSSRDETVSKQQPVEKVLNTVSNAVPKEKSSAVKSGCGADPSKPPCKKAKQMRLQRKLEKLNASGENTVVKTPKNKEKSLEDFINEIPESARNRLKIKLVRTTPPSPEWLETSSVSYSLYYKYQLAIHKDKPEKCTEKQFQEFLVKSPFQADESEDGPPMGYGSFHQQYWFDDELIAVGVIDILPKCISSVYFFCDPKYSYLSLGTYGALRELEFTRKLESQYKELRNYYMGFYIHSCQKMRYKGNFHPSYLLCPETYEWFPIEDCIKKMEVSKYSRLNPDINAIDRYLCTEDDIKNILILIGNSYMKYSIYLYQKAKEPNNKRILKKKEKQSDVVDGGSLIEFAKLVGKKCYDKIIFVGK